MRPKNGYTRWHTRRWAQSGRDQRKRAKGKHGRRLTAREQGAVDRRVIQAVRKLERAVEVGTNSERQGVRQSCTSSLSSSTHNRDVARHNGRHGGH